MTGANVSPTVNGEPIPMYQAVPVHAGDTVAFGVATGGARAYIAFAGGLDVPVVMGSKATLMRNKIGGVEGRKLEKGDAIGFVNPKTSLPAGAGEIPPEGHHPAGGDRPSGHGLLRGGGAQILLVQRHYHQRI